MGDAGRQSPSRRLPCPKCGYDLVATPGDICPECGGAFDRAQLLLTPEGEPDRSGRYNGLLVLAFVLAMVQFSLGAQSAAWFQPTWFAAVWVCALSWVYLRRRAIVSGGSWMLVWIAPIALWAWNRPNVGSPLTEIFIGVSALVAIMAVGFALFDNPKGAAGGLLLIAGLFFAFSGVVFIGGAVFAGPGASFEVGASLAAGGLNNAIAGMIGLIFAGAGWWALRVGRRLLPARGGG